MAEYKSFDQMKGELSKTCEKCGRTMYVTNFFTTNRKDKYPDGKLNVCKKCLTMHVNNYDPKTFIPILQEIDVPYIEKEWNLILEQEREKDPHKAPTAPVLGRYVSKMKLSQWKDFRFTDSEKAAQLYETYGENVVEQIINNINNSDEKPKVGLNIEDITPDILENLSEIDINRLFPDKEIEEIKQNVESINIKPDDLTLEDRQYLSLKWGKLYKTDEWIRLEQFYNEMLQSFDIQTASHFDYLKKICKVSLKMEQALDAGDIEGFQKLSKVYDSLMKSANFTAIQNKEDANFFVSSVGELVALCEEKGFITKFHTNEPKDIVDFTLKDMNNFTAKLIRNEMGLGNMIEAALQKMIQIAQEDSGALDEIEDDILVEDNLFEDIESDILNDLNEVGDDEDGIEGYIGEDVGE